MGYRALAPLVLLCFVSAVAAQDAVKLSGFWIEPVTVLLIQDGHVRYETTQGAVLSRPISQLEGLRLQRYPTLGEAQDAIENGDDRNAAVLYKQTSDLAHEQWVRFYAGAQRVAALARLDEAEVAVAEYVDLMMAGADLACLAEPPVDALARADAEVRQRAIKLIMTVRDAVDEQQADLLQSLLEAAGQPTNVVTMAQDPNDRNGNAGGLVLSSSVPPGTIVNLFNHNRYQEALLAADEALAQPGRAAAELYLKGMAQLALAELESDARGYKSAGLSFMRVVTYYPRSAVSGPAWLEAGYVHEKIGRTDIAARLYRRAHAFIHEDEDPETYLRLLDLINRTDDATDDD